jgi:mono/diheme cytochrome c family protein
LEEDLMKRIAIVIGLGVMAALLHGNPAGAQDKNGQAARAASLAKDVLPILKASCGKCHSGGGSKGGIDLSSYATMKKGGKGGPVFVEGDPDKSPLVTSISGDKPDMPKKATPLTKAQVAAISAWVKEGAKNN